MKVTHNNLTIERFEHDTIVIQSQQESLTVVFDPFQGKGAFRPGFHADIVFISHDHFDHFSPKDIQAVANRQTRYVFPASILDKIQGFLDVPEDRLVPVVPLEQYTIDHKSGAFTCMAVPAYNVDKVSPQGNLYHPKEKAYVGFLLDIGGTTVYFVGDSDIIPEMQYLAGMVQILLLPVSGVYVMTAQEAVTATCALLPQLVIPMHYGSIVGEQNLGELFRQQLAEVAPSITVAL